MPYLYQRYLREGAGTCRACKRGEAPTREPERPTVPLFCPGPAEEEGPQEDRHQLLSPEEIRAEHGGRDVWREEHSGWEAWLDSLYPLRIRQIRDYVREEVDRWDGAGSFLYDEYPDRAPMDRARDRIYGRLVADSVSAIREAPAFGRDVTEALLYGEIAARRRRRWDGR